MTEDDLDGLDEPSTEDDALLEALAATPTHEVLPRRTVVDGQYRIERVIGEGGMGVVYLAHDLRLERDVAIKIGIERSATAVGRLAREALAIAQLSHPNVVVVHQVGELRGRSYVAMEYVPGGTARTWCRERTWREALALYVAAGAGLAAAHAAGLVHRDFKPDNVLVGLDGRPRVADFGLARADGEVADAGPPAFAALTATRTRGVVGTPAYMAPEQAADGDVDARADQYAFCASVWEALFGVRPDADRAVASSEVPRRVVAALRRGLEPEREARWPTLAPLLAELRPEPARRTAIVLGGGLAIVGVAIASALVARGGSEDPCGGGTAAIATTWAPARAAAVRAMLAPVGSPPWIQHTGERAVATVDAWAARWAVQHRAVCEAGRTTWSPAMHDRGVECLAERQRELAATVDVLATTAAQASNADRIVRALEEPARCSDAAYLAVTVPPPTDPARAARVERELAELAAIAPLALAGKTARATALATAALSRAREVAYDPLVARARYLHGRVALLAEDYATASTEYRDAYFVARANRDEHTAALAASGRAVTLLDLSRDADAVEWADLARVEAALASDPEVELEACGATTAVLHARGEGPDALASAERCLALARRLQQPVVEPLRARSSAHHLLGHDELALADLDLATDELRTRYGADHPELAKIDSERALVLVSLHRLDDAVAMARRALATAEAAAGPDAGETVNALAVLGTTLNVAHRFGEARPILERSLAIDRKLAPRGYNVASDLNGLADLLQATAHLDEALAAWREASEIFREVVGPNGNEVGLVAVNVANALLEVDRTAEAGTFAESALVALAKTPDAAPYAQSLVVIGMAAVERRDWVRATEFLSRGLVKVDDDPRWRSRARFSLARVALARGDRTTARSLALAARDDARAGGQPNYALEIEKMIAALPR